MTPAWLKDRERYFRVQNSRPARRERRGRPPFVPPALSSMMMPDAARQALEPDTIRTPHGSR